MHNDKNVTPWDLCIKHIILFLFFMMITRLAIQSALQIAKGKNIFFTKKYDAPRFQENKVGQGLGLH